MIVHDSDCINVHNWCMAQLREYQLSDYQLRDKPDWLFVLAGMCTSQHCNARSDCASLQKYCAGRAALQPSNKARMACVIGRGSTAVSPTTPTNYFSVPLCNPGARQCDRQTVHWLLLCSVCARRSYKARLPVCALAGLVQGSPASLTLPPGFLT